ncbi:S-adenosyl-methyltransferase MraW [Mycoplasmopsis californica]|uniref:Ribosomal RNA small subunit methyltransferase H n=1 Tax=Mycoplasmopsis equigenitalium TaxID=114883 RepID=A0ABY5J084_9BACT|nr:16S rRNA (cytosine(1402)-N(4))-methyltransferase RsmH [Mycoplasmopsis equigenitalium]UUD36673.1 16S rRNA (cytosine(1402)-N(4))-methyltransferase RsmH [Mycoplasmopsis equigenitalium]VEU69365.1 S-adenosyl-methyltransferase MraW [Mycoplasmopsis californica]
MSSELHIPVLLDEVIDQLNIQEDDIIVDLTIGLGGHSSCILKKLNSGLLVGFDKDNYAIEKSSNRLGKIGHNFKLFKSDYQHFNDYLAQLKIDKVSGILADLGISSPQIDIQERGFSYFQDARLDMRMDQEQKLDAYEVVNNYPVEKLAEILNAYGQVKLSKQIAKAIVEHRPITTTAELATLIRDTYPNAMTRKKNLIKPIFQAIRIEVNNELDSLKNMLKKTLNFLKRNGKLLIITFHSLEDKIVKDFFGSLIKHNDPKLPVMLSQEYKVKTIYPSQTEINTNKRARSAKLRVLTKLVD